MLQCHYVLLIAFQASDAMLLALAPQRAPSVACGPAAMEIPAVAADDLCVQV